MLNIFIGKLLAINMALTKLIYFVKLERPKNQNITFLIDS